MLRSDKDAAKFAKTEVAKLSTSWMEPQWDELDWAKVKEMTTREILDQRNQNATKAQQGHCFECPNFIKHVSDTLFVI